MTSIDIIGFDSELYKKAVSKELCFIEETHTYFLYLVFKDNTDCYMRIPSVTQILKFCGFDADLEDLPEYAQARIKNAGERGRNIHDAIKILNTGGELSEESRQELLEFGDMPYVEAAMNFKRRFVEKIESVEQRVWVDGERPYAGTYDDIFKLTEGEKVLNDYKTAAKMKASYAIQLFAYYYARAWMNHLAKQKDPPLPCITGMEYLQTTHLKKDATFDIYRIGLVEIMNSEIPYLFELCLEYFYDPENEELSERVRCEISDFNSKYKSLAAIMPKVLIIPESVSVIDDLYTDDLLTEHAYLKTVIKINQSRVDEIEDYIKEEYKDYSAVAIAGKKTRLIEFSYVNTTKFTPDALTQKYLTMHANQRGLYTKGGYYKLGIKE